MKPQENRSNWRTAWQAGGSQGFSLIEISIVLFLLSLLLAIFLSTMTAILSIGQRDKDAGIGGACLHVVNAIGQLLEQIYYVQNNEELFLIANSLEQLDEKGNRLTFQTYQGYAQSRRTSAVREISILYKSVSDSFYPALILREDSLVDHDPMAGGIEIVLIDNVKKFTAEYSANGASWVSDWDSKTSATIPYAVRLSLNLATATGIEASCQTLVFTGNSRQ